jgi:hypothetical protein
LKYQQLRELGYNFQWRRENKRKKKKGLPIINQITTQNMCHTYRKRTQQGVGVFLNVKWGRTPLL